MPANSSVSTFVRGSDGNLWYADPAADRIGRVTAAGQVTRFGGPNRGLQVPSHLTLGPGGDIWFFDTGNGRLGRITPAGVITQYPPIGFGTAIAGLARGPDGNLWATFQDQSLNNYRLLRIDANGNEVSPAFLTTQLGFPGLLVRRADELYFVNRVLDTDHFVDALARFEPPGPPLCSNRQPTVVIGDLEAPTAGPDVILGTARGERIDALGGGDVVCSVGGNDTVNAGAGPDTVIAGLGADTVNGGLGNDVLSGQDGPDTLDGQDGGDRMIGGPAADHCNGGPGTDTAAQCEARIGVP